MAAPLSRLEDRFEPVCGGSLRGLQGADDLGHDTEADGPLDVRAQRRGVVDPFLVSCDLVTAEGQWALGTYALDLLRGRRR